jgi:flagellar biosynthesis protein
MNKKTGVALQYNGNDAIPRIIARAKGHLLEKILEIAEKYNITVYKDADVAQALSALDVGDYIPEDLYQAVAEVIAYCYNVNKELREKIDGRRM